MAAIAMEIAVGVDRRRVVAFFALGVDIDAVGEMIAETQ